MSLESFDTKYQGAPVTAYLNDDYEITRVLLRGLQIEVTGIDLEQFTKDQYFNIEQVRKEIEQEGREYSAHCRMLSDAQGWGR